MMPLAEANMEVAERAILKRAAQHMGVPDKVVGAIGGCFWVDHLDPAKSGRMWDAWNPLRLPKQALELIVDNKFSVFWLDADEKSDNKPVVVVDDTYVPYDPSKEGDAIKALCRAATIATAALLKESA